LFAGTQPRCWLLVATYQLEEHEISGNAVLMQIDEATKAMY